MKNSLNEVDIVLVHGWGINAEIWRPFVDVAKTQNSSLRFHLIDLPGYGSDHHIKGSSDIDEMALHCLDKAPDSAVWVGWSLGGLVAIKALKLADKGKIKALQLIGTMPKFTASPDFEEGVDSAIFQRFANELKLDYSQAMARFLQLQLFRVDGGRQLIAEAMQMMAKYPNPSPHTLQAGINCLFKTDLREVARQIGAAAPVPMQVISGSLDRVANPDGVAYLAHCLSAELVEIHTGHAVFLAEPEALLDHLENLVEQIYV